MADDLTEPSAPPLEDLAKSISAEILTPQNLGKLTTHARNIAIESSKDVFEVAWSLVGTLASQAIKLILDGMNAPEAAYDKLADLALDSLLGKGPQRGRVDDGIGRRIIERVAGSASTVEPSATPAERYLTIMTRESIEAWTRGVIAELVSEFVPRLVGVGGGIETIAQLEDIISAAMGGERMLRRVLQPFMSATVITPAQWHVNKQYRPELLSPSASVEALLTGQWDGVKATEELARAGYSDERIAVLIENARKRFTIDELVFQYMRGDISDLDMNAAAQKLGYDVGYAQARIKMEIAQRRERAFAPVVTDAVSSFVGWQIDEPTFVAAIRAGEPNYTEGQYIIAASKIRRAFNRKGLSSSQVATLAKQGILAVSDYRRALDAEGYVPEAAIALELALRKSIQEDRAIDELRRQADIERAAEKKIRDEERAAKRAELAERRDRTFPSLAEYERAAVRGLIPIDVYAAQLERLRYAPDDIAFLVADVNAQRDDYLATEAQRNDADARLKAVELSIADVRALILRGLMSIGEYAQILESRGFSAADANRLAALMQADVDDRRLAEDRRKAREAELARRGISLPEFERAVRRGLRDIASYDALLRQQGYDDIDRALLVDLLEAQLADDRDARERKAAAEARADERGLPLATIEQAVRRGVLTLNDYREALAKLQLSPKDSTTLVALLEAELAEDEAARRRREEIAAEVKAPGLTMGQIERGVRLGLLDMTAYRQFLITAGYGAADVDLLVALLAEELRAVRNAQERRTQIAAELTRRAVSLGDFEKAVKRGARSLVEYAGFVHDAGYSAADVDLLVQLLSEEVDIDLAKLRGKLSTTLSKAEPPIALSDIEESLARGGVDERGARRALEAAGVSADEALVFVRLIVSLVT